MSSLIDKLLKNSTIKQTALITKSKVYGKKEIVKTDVPAINVALSGELDGGLLPGLLTIAGPSKHFKSGFTLLMAAAYQKQYKDGVILFYDSEFGTPLSFLESFGVDLERVVHTPLVNIEELKFDIAKQLDNIEKGDKICIIIDSVGNLASLKEAEDALDGKSVADMSRAKQLKSLFRIITPHLNLKDIPLIVISHTYDTQEMYSKKIVSGGCLVHGTKIKLANGQLKEIQDITEEDTVLTLLGERKVTNIWNPETLLNGTPECFEIEFEDGSSVMCSDEHKFLINGDWIEAKDLKEGMICKKI